MYKINNIAVLYGGSSSEREISLESGNRVHKSILELGYESCLIDFNDLESLDKLINYDYVFIALHGFEGEGGKLQDNLDKLNIRYSGSGPNACSNTWNKKLTKEILYKNHIRTPKWLAFLLVNKLLKMALMHLHLINSDPLIICSLNHKKMAQALIFSK
jgi:D-alanine-D-alanine ligase